MIKKLFMASSLVFASAPAIANEVDGLKAIFCVVIGENAEAYAKGRMNGITEQYARESSVNLMEESITKTMISDAVSFVYSINDDQFYSLGFEAPEKFRNLTVSRCLKQVFK